MFKKTLYFSYILFLVLFSSIGQVSYAAQTAEQRNTQASQIATEIGISQDAWFSSSQRTMNTIQQGLLEIDNQKTFLREKGVAETEITKVEGAQMSALKNYAQATHAQENIGIFTGTEKTKALNGNLLEAQANFAKTLGNIYTMNGLETESKIYNDSARETQQKADLAYQGKSSRDVVVVESKPLIIPGGPDKYTLLAPIGTFFPGGSIDIKGGGLGGYLNGLYRAGIAIATGLALVMIVVGGLEYVSTDSIQGKSNGRERIKNAIIGLLLALTSFIILRQINPNLLKSDLNVTATQSTGTVGGSAIDLVNRPPVDSLAAYPLTQQLVNDGLQVGGINLGTGGGRCVRGPNGINTSGSKIKPRYIPNLNWSSYALSLIQKSRLPQTNPIDAGSYFVGGKVTAEGWLLIIGGMIECESSFNPNTTYQEPGGTKGPGTLSVGLLQMSKEDPEAKRKGYGDQDLKDPLKNLEVGIGRLESLVLRDNCITCWSGPTGWRGASAYWSVLRNK